MGKSLAVFGIMAAAAIVSIAYFMTRAATVSGETVYEGLFGRLQPVSGTIRVEKDTFSDNFVSVKIPIMTIPGSTPIDLTKVTVSVRTPGELQDTAAFEVIPAGKTVLRSGEMVELLIHTQPMPTSTTFTITITPSNGNFIDINRTTPSTIGNTEIYY